MGRQQNRGMVLPPHERSSGEISYGQNSLWLGSDPRVPKALRDRAADHFGEDHPATVVGHIHRSDQCPSGRHLFDLIESTIWHEREVHDERTDSYDYVEEAEFRTVLTCVRCGLVQQWEGTRTETRTTRLAPEPLAAGDLLAQQVSASERWGRDRDMSRWIVYGAGTRERVGFIDWRCGPRGRAFHEGRLDAWEPGHTVEGKDPAAVLRKLAAALREGTTPQPVIAGAR